MVSIKILSAHLITVAPKKFPTDHACQCVLSFYFNSQWPPTVTLCTRKLIEDLLEYLSFTLQIAEPPPPAHSTKLLLKLLSEPGRALQLLISTMETYILTHIRQDKSFLQCRWQIYVSKVVFNIFVFVFDISTLINTSASWRVSDTCSPVCPHPGKNYKPDEKSIAVVRYRSPYTKAASSTPKLSRSSGRQTGGYLDRFTRSSVINFDRNIQNEKQSFF